MSGYRWDFGVVLDSLPQLAGGAVVTIVLTVLTFALSVVLGLVLCLLRMAPSRLLSWPTVAVVDFLRLTPLLAQILLVYYGLPFLGIVLSPFWSGVLALGINSAAFTCEIFRSGFQSVDPGTREAGEALGMTRGQTLRRLLLPTALRKVAGPLGTTWVSAFQDTSLVAVLGVTELLHSAQILSAETLRPVELFTTVGIIYFVLAYPQARLVERIRRRTQQ